MLEKETKLNLRDTMTSVAAAAAALLSSPLPSLSLRSETKCDAETRPFASPSWAHLFDFDAQAASR